MRVALGVVGGIAALLALGLIVAGGFLLWVDRTQRDAEGWLTTRSEPFATSSYALVSKSIEVGAEGPDWLYEPARLGRMRIRVSSDDPGKAVFVGVARERDVLRYLDGVPRAAVTDLHFHPFRVDYESRGGDTTPTPPGAQTFWAASASGPGVQTAVWDVESGRWTVVVMYADASPGVAVHASVGAKLGFLLWVSIVLIALGVLAGLGAAAGFVFAFAGRSPPVAPEGGGVMTGVTAEASAEAKGYPVRLEARLDEPLSRWLWLVKWFLAMPHYIVLAFLWIAFTFLTIFAWFAILFTGRYPREIFDFNLGVMRWTWRVGYYATSVLGTDRYPPFTLAAVPDYPATLDVEYPQRLSRGLVLVKSWLLAIPHLIVVVIFTGGWFGWMSEEGHWRTSAPGLIGVLSLIAVVILAFRGTYPRDLHTLIVGLCRWVARAGAYVALMRDEYPPFRLEP